jgi:copine 5/8/9
LSGFKCEERATFLDYIFGGCEINVHVAIDFTLSNGDPSKSDSLHYINPHTGTNLYTDALAACLGILENYDDDKEFPVYGFGGKIPDC